MPSHDPYAPIRVPAFTRFLIGHTCALMGQAMIATAIGWDLYERTGSALALGWVGLVLFVPVALFALPAGQLADRYDRRLIVMAASTVMATSSLGLAWVALTNGPLWIYYAMLFAAGTGYAFLSPAKSALLPALVPADMLGQAITWSTGVGQFAFLAGPAIAGAVIGLTHGAITVYLLDALAASGFVLSLFGLRVTPREVAVNQAAGWSELLAGLRFVRDSELLLAAITLDMVAVLLGGAVALLPIFAKDVLGVGPEGLGWLSTAQSVGAFLMGIALTHLPPIRRNGPVLLWMIAGFGVASVGFGLATHLIVAWVMLFFAGAFDMVSMVIRSHMVQTLTPDAMRGRVAAVHSVFVGTSNELGGFESGVTAAWFGPVRSVVFGGLGTLLVVGLVAWRLPGLRRLGELKVPEA